MEDAGWRVVQSALVGVVFIMVRIPKIDPEAAFAFWLSHGVSHQEVADEMGCSKAYISELSSKHNWVARRQAMQAEAAAAAISCVQDALTASAIQRVEAGLALLRAGRAALESIDPAELTPSEAARWARDGAKLLHDEQALALKAQEREHGETTKRIELILADTYQKLTARETPKLIEEPEE